MFQTKPVHHNDLHTKIAPNLSFLVGYFDSVEHGGRCGCSAWIHIDYNQHYTIHWSRGTRTNTGVEAVALWGLMWFVSFLNIPKLQIYGDSLAIINHVLGSSSLSHPHLQGWFRNIEYLKGTFQNINLQHIHREFNTTADVMSKQGIMDPPGSMHISFGMGNTYMDVGSILLLG